MLEIFGRSQVLFADETFKSNIIKTGKFTLAFKVSQIHIWTNYIYYIIPFLYIQQSSCRKYRCFAVSHIKFCTYMTYTFCLNAYFETYRLTLFLHLSLKNSSTVVPPDLHIIILEFFFLEYAIFVFTVTGTYIILFIIRTLKLNLNRKRINLVEKLELNFRTSFFKLYEAWRIFQICKDRMSDVLSILKHDGYQDIYRPSLY